MEHVSHRKRSLLAASVAAALVSIAVSNVNAEYRFVRIADTRDGGYFLDNSRHAAINNAGDVVLYRGLPGAVAEFSLGNGGALSTVATTASGPLAGLTLYRPSFNDSGQIAFYAEDVSSSEPFRIYRAGPGGTTLIAAAGAGTFGGFVPNVAINNPGNVAFTSASSLYIGNGTSNTKLYPISGDGVTHVGSGPSLNNFGTASFSGGYAPASGPAQMKGAGSSVDVIGSTSVNDLSILVESVISDGGLVMFGATRFGAPQGIFTGSGGSVLSTFVDVDGPYSNLPIQHESGFAAGGYPTMNNTGTIAFVGDLDAGGRGIFTGADPSTSSVIYVGETLFGGTVGHVFGLGREAINDAGEIAFHANLTGLGEVIVKAIPAVNMKWEDDSDGVWSDDDNWLGPVPNAYQHDANFTDAITAPRTVTVDGAFTVGSINFDNANSYTIDGGGVITLDDSYVATVNVLSGSHVVSASLASSRDTTIFTSGGAGLVASNLQPTSASIQKTGVGTLAVNRVIAGALHVNGGTVTMLANGTDSGTSRVGTLTIAGALPLSESMGAPATLDLRDNDLIVANSSYAAISTAVAAARNGGAWDLPGLTSSAARDHSAGATMLGVMSGSEYESIYGAGAAFGPFTVASTDTLVKYTWYGDADFNGEVNFDDYVRIDGGYNFALTGWINGDFDLSGGVDFDDYVLIDLGFNSQSGTLRRALAFLDGSDRSSRGMDTPELRQVVDHFERFGIEYATSFLTAVPEPTSVISAGVTLVTLVRRQRRVRH